MNHSFLYFWDAHRNVIARPVLAASFADANFTEEEIETYEYTPWGLLMTSAHKNNILYASKELDFDTVTYINKGLPYNYDLGNFIKKNNLPVAFYSFSIKNNPINFIITDYSYNTSYDISCRWCYLVCVCCDWGDCRIVWCVIFIYIHCRF